MFKQSPFRNGMCARRREIGKFEETVRTKNASRAKAKRRYCADARLGRSADSLLLMAPGRSWSLPLSLPDSALGPLTTLPPFPNQELALLVRSTADGQLENFPCAVSGYVEGEGERGSWLRGVGIGIGDQVRNKTQVERCTSTRDFLKRAVREYSPLPQVRNARGLREVSDARRDARRCRGHPDRLLLGFAEEPELQLVVPRAHGAGASAVRAHGGAVVTQVGNS
jgi:hypothetical protein